MGQQERKWDNTTKEEGRRIWRHRADKSNTLIWVLERLQECGHAFTTTIAEVQSDEWNFTKKVRSGDNSSDSTDSTDSSNSRNHALRV